MEIRQVERVAVVAECCVMGMLEEAGTGGCYAKSGKA